MKTNPATLRVTALLPAAVLAGIMGFSQPVSGQSAVSPRIDPVNGLPITGIPSSTGPNLITGTLSANQKIVSSEYSVSFDPLKAPIELHKLIVAGRYAEALQLCHTAHNHAVRVQNNGLVVIIPDWIELGRRYPQAKVDLIEIRDRDLGEFSKDQGYAHLFGIVYAINKALKQDDATYALFSTLREKDPALAQQCYSFVEGFLVAKGEYQWCYDHMGDVQDKFDDLHRRLEECLANQRFMAELHQKTAQRMEAANRQQGKTNIWSTPDISDKLKQGAYAYFVGQTLQMIEILVATGHKADAETIRDQAVAVLDDPRLRSAVRDAEAKIRQIGANAGRLSK